MDYQIFRRGQSRKYQINHGGHNITLLVCPGNEPPEDFPVGAPYLSSDQPGQDSSTSVELNSLIKALEWVRGRL